MEVITKQIPVTVIIPCFNCIDTITQTLNSVKAQTLQPSEIILIDDCSTDGTVNFLNTILPEYPFARLITLPVNSGPGIARNVGWEASTQPWLAFLDADDTWHPDKLRIQWKHIQENTDVTIWGHQTAFISESDNVLEKNITIQKVTLDQMLISNRFPTRSVMLKKDISFRFRDKTVTEDYLLWLEIISSGYTAVKINAVLSFSLRPDFSPGGYSGQLWRHEKRELRALKILQAEKRIASPKFVLYTALSLVKFLRRMLISKAALKKTA